ncbi:hypothetical protein B4065_3338 [Caldibacillus thermoamylovorans]|uniref:hypothetical protein n=1 Tax=Caldibacillus thermoamylovorans TaxID=35841 RepID=UPI0005A48112|nr:hypothetical protein [Caldibacillus thermoamylovorans]KIO62118.1 hypothetical protein B4065_3338 [Caldibacillus thermoamylovorans]
MNKRQRKKLDNKLRIAIKELNNDVAKYDGYPLITSEEVEETLKRVKKTKEGINRTLRDYKRFIMS